jgi:hypothetical protein
LSAHTFRVTIEDVHRAAHGTRAKEAVMFEHILIPTDGSALSSKAVTGGIAFVKSIGARITVVMTLRLRRAPGRSRRLRDTGGRQ